jgi:NAD(P)-dependent dehydrogenase (short-subunit alcohol dehydrogenase family)
MESPDLPVPLQVRHPLPWRTGCAGDAEVRQRPGLVRKPRCTVAHAHRTGHRSFKGNRPSHRIPAGGVRDEEAGESLIQGSAGKITPVVLDITDDGQVAALDQVLPATLDAVVNNAGVVVGGPVEGVTIPEFRRQLEVNLIGQVAVTQTVLPRIRLSRGRIVFVSSISGWISSPLVGAYSASKFGLEGMADALRIELRPWHIPVVLVEPAQTSTDMWHNAMDQMDATVAMMTPDHRRLYAKHIAGQRKGIPKSQKMATPAEGAAAVIEHALTVKRPRARYVVGTGPRVIGAVARVVPTRVMDLVLATMGGVPRKP